MKKIHKKITKITAITGLVALTSLSAIIPPISSHHFSSTNSSSANTNPISNSHSQLMSYATSPSVSKTTSASISSVLNIIQTPNKTEYSSLLSNITNIPSDLPWYNLNGFLNALLQVCINENTNSTLTTFNNKTYASPYLTFIQSFPQNLALYLTNLYQTDNVLLSSILLIPTPSANGMQISMQLTFNGTITSYNNQAESMIWQLTNSNDISYNKNTLYLETIPSTSQQVPIFSYTSALATITELASVNSSFLNQLNAFIDLSNQSDLGINQFSIIWNPLSQTTSTSNSSFLTFNFGFYNPSIQTAVIPQPSKASSDITPIYNSTNSVSQAQLFGFGGDEASTFIPSNTLNYQASISNLTGINFNTIALSSSTLSINYNYDASAVLNPEIASSNGIINLQSSTLTPSIPMITSSYLTSITEGNGIISSPAICSWLTKYLFPYSNSFHISQFTISPQGNNYLITNLWLINTQTANWISPFLALNSSNSSAIFNNALAFNNNQTNFNSGSGISLTSYSVSITLTNPYKTLSTSSQIPNSASTISVTTTDVLTKNASNKLVPYDTLSSSAIESPIYSFTIPLNSSNTTLLNGINSLTNQSSNTPILSNVNLYFENGSSTYYLTNFQLILAPLTTFSKGITTQFALSSNINQLTFNWISNSGDGFYYTIAYGSTGSNNDIPFIIELIPNSINEASSSLSINLPTNNIAYNKDLVPQYVYYGSNNQLTNSVSNPNVVIPPSTPSATQKKDGYYTPISSYTFSTKYYSSSLIYLPNTLSDELANSINPISSATWTSSTSSSYSYVSSNNNITFNISLAKFKVLLNQLVLEQSSDYPSFVNYVIETFFPNWFHNNLLTQTFSTSNGNSINWINNFITDLKTIFGDNGNVLTQQKNPNTYSFSWSPNVLFQMQSLLNSSLPIEFEWNVTFAPNQLVSQNVPNLTYNVANVLNNQSTFTNDFINNSSTNYTNLFQPNFIASLTNGLTGFNITDFYNYLENGTNNNALTYNFLSMILKNLYELKNSEVNWNNTSSSFENFYTLIQTIAKNSSYTLPQSNLDFCVIGANQIGTQIEGVQLLINGYYFDLSNLRFTFSPIISQNTINISNLKDAQYLAQWLESWKKGSTIITQINNQYIYQNVPSSWFLKTRTLTLLPQNITLNNDIYYQNNTSMSAFNYNSNNFTGFLPEVNGNYNWLTWNVFEGFITTCLSQTSTNPNILSDSDLFNGITNLVIADVDFSSVSASQVIQNILTWFPSLNSLTLQNCNLQGSCDLVQISNNLNGKVALKNLNINHNSINLLNLYGGMNSVDASYNKINSLNQNVTISSQSLNYALMKQHYVLNSTSTISNNDLLLPSVCLNLSNNKLSDLSNLTISFASASTGLSTISVNSALINLSNNKLSTFNFADWVVSPSSFDSASSISDYFPYQTQINLSSNALISLTGLDSQFGTNCDVVSNQDANYYYYPTTTNQWILHLNFTSQRVDAYWLFQTNNVSNSAINETLLPSSSISSAQSWYNNNQSFGIDLEALATGLNNNYSNNPIINPNISGNIINSPTWLSSYISNYQVGLLSQTNFDSNVYSMSKLYDILNNTSANSTIATNGNYLMNEANLQNATFTLTNSSNGLSSSSITWNDFIDNYAGIIPYNDIQLYNILTQTDKIPSSFEGKLNLFQQGFNLQGQTLIKIYKSNTNYSDYTSAISNWTNGEMGLVNNRLVLSAGDEANYYYITSIATSYPTSSNTYATLTINNASSNSVLNLNFIITNQINNTISYNSTITNYAGNGLSNVNEITLGYITKNNGIGGYYNLYDSGFLDTLNPNPFDNGIDYALYYNFINDKIYSNNSLSLSSILNQQLNVTQTGTKITFNNLAQQITTIKDSGTKNYQIFENSLYQLLQEEGIISYHQVDSLYGTWNNSNFTLSSSFSTNTNLTLSNVTDALSNASSSKSSNGTFSLGISASAEQKLINGLYVSGSDASSFYQSPVWANFLDTTINQQGQTLGNALYENGTWNSNSSNEINYTMPSYNNELFQTNSIAKQTYDNLMSLFGFSDNLTSSEFNNQITAIYPNYYTDVINQTATNPYTSALNDATLFNVFSYDDGSVINQYTLYTNSQQDNWVGLNLNYLNKFQNISNSDDTYEFNAIIYGKNYFTGADSIFNSTNNILASGTFNVKLANNKAYTWTQLENNETMNLIPYDVYQNIGTISNNNQTDSAQWIPVVDWNSIIQTERREFIQNVSIASVGAFIVLSATIMIGGWYYHKNKKDKKKVKSLDTLANYKSDEVNTDLSLPPQDIASNIFDLDE